MSFFIPLDAHCVLRSNGVFSEHQLYHLDGEIFARKGNGYIRLYDNQATSRSRTFWQDLRMETPLPLTYKIGKLFLDSTKTMIRKSA